MQDPEPDQHIECGDPAEGGHMTSDPCELYLARVGSGKKIRVRPDPDTQPCSGDKKEQM